MAIMISGIGRSGTTTLYKIVGRGLLGQHGGGRCVYEPYLWSMPEIEKVADTREQPFSVQQVGLFNMYVHCHTPLFLSGRNLLHDKWLERVFGPTLPASRMAPENVMAKVIRGAGRLEAMLTRFDNLKVVVVTRNPVDTINSGLGLFSFYGDEFHPSDKMRFIEEVNRVFGVDIQPDKMSNEIDWSALWWHYLTEASLRTHQKFPERVLLVPYEKYLQDMKQIMLQIYGFCGIKSEYLDEDLFGSDAGVRTTVTYLDENNLRRLDGELDWYLSRLNDIGVLTQDCGEFRQRLQGKYRKRKFVRSLLLTERTDHTAVSWRFRLKEYLAERETSDPLPETASAKMLTVAQAVVDFGDNSSALGKARKMNEKQSGTRKEPTLGVLITSFNNKATIEESLYSVLMQSKKPDLIVVADDASTDGSSPEILRNIAAKYPSVHLELRQANLGVAANRDLAIRSMDVDYITTLDGDDLFLPGKLEIEYTALAGQMDRVAFSNVAMVHPDGNRVLDTSAYSKRSKHEMLQMLASRSCPVPRDMMFPKKLFEAAEGFDVAMNMYEDWAFKMRLMIAGPEGGWIWSGGNGTVYDRRSPGLSRKPIIYQAHSQLLALARNVDRLISFPGTILAGLRTVASCLESEDKQIMLAAIAESESCGEIDAVVASLKDVWSRSYFGDNETRRKVAMQEFINNLRWNATGN